MCLIYKTYGLICKRKYGLKCLRSEKKIIYLNSLTKIKHYGILRHESAIFTGSLDNRNLSFKMAASMRDITIT